MAIYFFSDAHLGAADRQCEDHKLAMLDRLIERIETDGEKVFILGDLFDFWFEYKHAIPKEHLKIVFKLASLVERGIKIHYITGNHDFWLGGFLNREAGIVIHRDFLEINEQGKRIFLIHGDGLSPSDWKYRILRRILRNRLNIWLYRRIPPDWAIPLAKYVSSTSRHHTGERSKDFLRDYEVYAESKIAEGYDAVLIGHTHHPEYHDLKNGVYINTGDFIRHFSYARLDDGQLALEFLDNGK